MNSEPIKFLYEAWIKSWNDKDADRMSSLLSETANMVGFDGSEMNGPEEVRKTIGDIFKVHQTAEFITIIKEIRFLSPQTALLRANVGMIPRFQDDIFVNVNAIQTMVASQKDGNWKIELFQNTPAAFHGRPDEVAKFTEELRAELRKRKI